MARTPFKVEVLTPEGEVFNDEVEMVSTRTSVGSIGILANHQPLLAMLDPTELRLYKSESEVVRFAQGEGFLQMTGDARARARRRGLPGRRARRAPTCATGSQRAEQELADAEEGTEERRAAERDKRRYEAFLKLAERRLAAKSVAAGAFRRYPPADGRTALAERLITYDTSNVDGLRAAAGFVKGWLEARDIDVERPRSSASCRSP